MPWIRGSAAAPGPSPDPNKSAQRRGSCHGRRLLHAEPRLTVRRFEVLPVGRLRPLARLRVLREFAASGVRAECGRR